MRYLMSIATYERDINPTTPRLPTEWKWTPLIVRDAMRSLRPPLTSFQTEPCQLNTHDCGVWVLALVAAILHGCRVSALHEEDCPSVRKYIASLILQYSSVP